MSKIKITTLLFALFASVLAPLPQGGLEVHKCYGSRFFWKGNERERIEPRSHLSDPANFFKHPYVLKDCRDISEAELEQLQTTGFLGHMYTLISPSNVGSLEILSHIMIDDYGYPHHVFAAKIKSGQFMGKYFVSFDEKPEILTQSELDDLKSFKTVKGYKLHPKGELIDVHVVNDEKEHLFTIKAIKKIKMREFYYQFLTLFAEITGEKVPYDTIEIDGVSHSPTYADLTLTFMDGDTITLRDTGNPIIDAGIFLPDGSYGGALIHQKFRTADIWEKTLSHLPNADLFSIMVNHKTPLLRSYKDDASDELHQLPDCKAVTIHTESCRRIYGLNPDTMRPEVFFVKQYDSGIYAEIEDKYVFVETIRSRELIDQVTRDGIINGKYIFCKQLKQEDIQQIGTMNSKSVYLIYKTENLAVIQTPERLVKLTLEQLNDLREGKKIIVQYRVVCEALPDMEQIHEEMQLEIHEEMQLD